MSNASAWARTVIAPNTAAASNIGFMERTKSTRDATQLHEEIPPLAPRIDPVCLLGVDMSSPAARNATLRRFSTPHRALP